MRNTPSSTKWMAYKYQTELPSLSLNKSRNPNHVSIHPSSIPFHPIPSEAQSKQCFMTLHRRSIAVQVMDITLDPKEVEPNRTKNAKTSVRLLSLFMYH